MPMIPVVNSKNKSHSENSLSLIRRRNHLMASCLFGGFTQTRLLVQVKQNQFTLIRFSLHWRNPSRFIPMGQGPEALQRKPGLLKGFCMCFRWSIQCCRFVISLRFVVPPPDFVFPSSSLLLFFCYSRHWTCFLFPVSTSYLPWTA